MGLDGLSINNLGLNRDNTSKENAIKADALANSRSLDSNNIDQLEKKQAISTEDHDNPSFSGGFTDDEDENDDIEDVYEGNPEDDEYCQEEQNQNDYNFIIDDSKKIIRVIDNETEKNVMEITIDDLSKFVSALKQFSGAIINKKA